MKHAISPHISGEPASDLDEAKQASEDKSDGHIMKDPTRKF
jgi:hypothetical protein